MCLSAIGSRGARLRPIVNPFRSVSSSNNFITSINYLTFYMVLHTFQVVTLSNYHIARFWFGNRCLCYGVCRLCHNGFVRNLENLYLFH